MNQCHIFPNIRIITQTGGGLNKITLETKFMDEDFTQDYIYYETDHVNKEEVIEKMKDSILSSVWSRFEKLN